MSRSIALQVGCTDLCNANNLSQIVIIRGRGGGVRPREMIFGVSLGTTAVLVNRKKYNRVYNNKKIITRVFEVRFF